MSRSPTSISVISDPKCRFRGQNPLKTAINQTYTPDYNGATAAKPNRVNPQSLAVWAICAEADAEPTHEQF